jgi:uncharacterized RDD family membrane protein YckC
MARESFLAGRSELELNLTGSARMSQDLWFYLDGARSIGPVSETKLAALLARNAITKETLLWKQGSPNWNPLHQVLPHLDVSPPPLPFAAPEREGGQTERLTASPPVTYGTSDQTPFSSGRNWDGGEPHPWRRYFARVLDTSLNGSLIAFLLGVVFYVFDNADADTLFTGLGNNRALDTILTYLFAIPANSVVIGLTGGSLGKWLFGVRILNPTGQPIGIGRAFKREWFVWVRALGFGIPIITIVTLIVAFRHLNRAGTASWDEEMGSVLVHRPRGLFRYFWV